MLLLIASTNQAIPQQRTNKTVVQKKRQQTTQKIKQNTKLLEQNKAETAKRLKELSVLEANIIELNKDIDVNQTSSDSLVALIKNITDTIGDYESRISNLTSKYLEFLVKPT